MTDVAQDVHQSEGAARAARSCPRRIEHVVFRHRRPAHFRRLFRRLHVLPRPESRAVPRQPGSAESGHRRRQYRCAAHKFTLRSAWAPQRRAPATQPPGFAPSGLHWPLALPFHCSRCSSAIPEISAGLTPGKNLFFMYYYVMTGMHLCHVVLGLVIMCFVIRNLKTSKPPRISFVETGATYWHMVDVLWLVLFALLYLMR